jgi:RecA-family ATPase
MEWSERSSRFPLLGWDDLEDAPPPRWLIDGHILSGGVGTLTGSSGSYKTFLALSMALSVATATPWFGASIGEPGVVVYVAAEGSRAAIRVRVEAWIDEHGHAHPGSFLLTPAPVNLWRRDDVDEFVTAIAPFRPRLICFDTLARCMAGADENSARDMGMVVENVGRIQRATDAAVLLVHHTGHDNKGRERGSSALRAAMDTAIQVKHEAGTVTAVCTKQKESEPFATQRWRPTPARDSLVLRRADSGPATSEERRQFQTLQVLREAQEPIAKTNLQKRVGGNAGANRRLWEAMVLDPDTPVTRDERGRLVYGFDRLGGVTSND